jgi:hypothetical protein
MTTDVTLPAGKKSGQATYYTFWNSAQVSCNPMKCPDDGFCAAIPLTYMQPSGSTKASCGKCIKVVYQQKAAIVRVMDTCPECPDTNIDMSDKLFQALVGDLGLGRVQVDWNFVDCNSGAAASGVQSSSASTSGTQSSTAATSGSTSSMSGMTMTSSAMTSTQFSLSQTTNSTMTASTQTQQQTTTSGKCCAKFKAQNAEIIIAIEGSNS